MTGYKVVRYEYSGKLVGDEIVYSDEEASNYVYAKELERARASTARSEEAPDIRLTKEEYAPLGAGQCRIGRVIHNLSSVTRKELVRQTALGKLNMEERDALGLPGA